MLKEPRIYCRPGESYEEARGRWRIKLSEFRDATVIEECARHVTPKGRHFLRAFYGIEMQYIDIDGYMAADKITTAEKRRATFRIVS